MDSMEANKEITELPEKTKTPLSFLAEEAESTIEEVHQILRNEQEARKKFKRIEKVVNKDQFDHWRKQVTSEKLVKGLNNMEKDWTAEMFDTLMLSLTYMEKEKAEEFLNFCRKWAIEKYWPEDYTIHRAIEILDGAKPTVPISQPPKDEQLSEKMSNDPEKPDDNKSKQGLEDQQKMEESKNEKQQEEQQRKNPKIGGCQKEQHKQLKSARGAEQEKGPEENGEGQEDEEEEVGDEEGSGENTFDEEIAENTMNIVVVGDSGNGKTTMINGIANCFAYRSFAEAVETGPKVYIPTKFTTFVGKRSKQPTVIQLSVTDGTGWEANENLNDEGGSVTKDPVTYTFRYKSGEATIVLNITDTPGMNDTEGAEQDEVNIKKIFRHMEKMPSIDAICLVMKTNEARLSLNLRTMLNSLLAKLPKENLGNVVICFTNGTSPGESLFLLNNHYASLLNTQANNIFCYDNEPFRYLCILQQCPQEIEDRKRRSACDDAFDHNRKELQRMLHRVETLTPFKLSTCSNLKSQPRALDIMPKPTVGNGAGGTSSRDVRQNATPTTTQPTAITRPPGTIRNTTTSPAISVHEEELANRNFLMELETQEMVRQLIEPLAVSLVYDINETKNLNLKLKEADKERKILKNQLFCICNACNGLRCDYTNGGADMCYHCQHHWEHHELKCNGGKTQMETRRSQLDRVNFEYIAIRSALEEREKEYGVVFHACLAFSMFLPPTNQSFPLQYPFCVELRQALNEIYNRELEAAGSNDDTTGLFQSISDFLSSFNTYVGDWAKKSVQTDVATVVKDIKALTTLALHVHLAQRASELLKEFSIRL